MRNHIALNALVELHDMYVVRRYFRQIWENKYHDHGTLRINDVSGNLIFHASEKVRIGTNTDPATQHTRHMS